MRSRKDQDHQRELFSFWGKGEQERPSCSTASKTSRDATGGRPFPKPLEGLIHRINDRVNELLHQHDPDAVEKSLTSMSAPLGLGSLSWASEEQYARVLGVRGRLTRVTDIANDGGTGVFVTVDEIPAGVSSELRELGITPGDSTPTTSRSPSMT